MAFALVLPATAVAEDVMRLEGPVTDTAGVLTDRVDDIEAAIEATLDDHGVQVFVLFVETTGELSAGDYAQQTAALNSLGVDDALLLVAIDDRTDYIWVSDSLDEITDDELDAILTDTLEPALRDGNEADGTIAAIEALGLAAESPAPTEPPVVPGPVEPTTPPSGGDGGSAPGDDRRAAAPGHRRLAAVPVVAGSPTRRRLRPAPPSRSLPSCPGPSCASAPTRCSSRPTSASATRARRSTSPRPSTVPTPSGSCAAPWPMPRASWRPRSRSASSSTTMCPRTRPPAMRCCARSSSARPGRSARSMRRRPTSAGCATSNATHRRRSSSCPVGSRTSRTGCRRRARRWPACDRYAESAWRPVAGNLEEVEKGLAGARTAVTVASAAMARDDRPAVAVATREALEGITGSTELLDAIDRVAASVADAERRLPAELAEAERDLRETRTVRPDAGAADAGIDARIGEVERALDAAHAAATARPADPVEALRLATEAHRLADEALVATRDAAAARDRLESTADSTIRTATIEYDRAATFIASRRPGVGDAARTRLAEAQRNLEAATAVAAQDPAAAIERARRAQQLAGEAYQLAASDFSGWDSGGPGWGQPRGGDATAELLGQILGGVIGGVIRSGAGGGWGGSPWGSPGRRGGGGFPDLGDLSGGWGRGGGFGTGTFGGGGGGRGRGGRW